MSERNWWQSGSIWFRWKLLAVDDQSKRIFHCVQGLSSLCGLVVLKAWHLSSLSVPGSPGMSWGSCWQGVTWTDRGACAALAYVTQVDLWSAESLNSGMCSVAHFLTGLVFADASALCISWELHFISEVLDAPEWITSLKWQCRLLLMAAAVLNICIKSTKCFQKNPETFFCISLFNVLVLKK